MSTGTPAAVRAAGPPANRNIFTLLKVMAWRGSAPGYTISWSLAQFGIPPPYWANECECRCMSMIGGRPAADCDLASHADASKTRGINPHSRLAMNDGPARHILEHPHANNCLMVRSGYRPVRHVA